MSSGCSLMKCAKTCACRWLTSIIGICREAAKDLKIPEVAVAGGVSANSGLRDAFVEYGKRFGWKVHIPKFSFTTDNAAMVAITGYYKFQDKVFCPMEAAPFARMEAKLG